MNSLWLPARRAFGSSLFCLPYRPSSHFPSALASYRSCRWAPSAAPKFYSTGEKPQENQPVKDGENDLQKQDKAPSGDDLNVASSDVKSAVDEKDAKIKELTDLWKRALAEQENIRERSRKEAESAAQFGIQKFAKDLLNVADILEMALSSVPETERNNNDNPHLKNLYEGLKMTEGELTRTFKRHSLEKFDPLGERFDPNMHQAVFEQPLSDKEPDTIIHVMKKGFSLKGRVIRAAQVGVAKAVDK